MLKVGRRFIGVLICALTFNSMTTLADGLSGIISAANSYIYRGYSKSDNEAFGRINADYEHPSGLYVGTWISRVNFGDSGFINRSSLEFYPYAGFNFEAAESWRLDVSIARYIYEGRIFGKTSDYNEYSLSIHFRDLISTRIAFSDNTYHRGETAFDYEISGRYPLAKNIDISAGAGCNNLNPDLLDDNAYGSRYYALYWNAGLTWFVKNWAVDFRYVDAAHYGASQQNDPDELPYIKDNFVFSISASF